MSALCKLFACRFGGPNDAVEEDMHAGDVMLLPAGLLHSWSVHLHDTYGWGLQSFLTVFDCSLCYICGDIHGRDALVHLFCSGLS